MKLLVDYFPYFAPYGDELLDLRVNLLRDHVDYFVIAESSRTHSGTPVPYMFPRAAEKLGLPMDRIIYVQDEIPHDEDLQILEIDVMNTYENAWRDGAQRLASQRARVRERLQKDALLKVLDRFSDDTVFIHGDYDEVMNPRENLRYIADRCRLNPERIYKLPMVLLESRADLRVHDRHTGTPVAWDHSAFVATKLQLQQSTPTQIRSERQISFEIHHITENGVVCQDLGWHFSWMGGSRTRQIKSQSYAHFQDGFSWMPQDKFTSFQDPRFQKWTQEHHYTDGSIPPSGNRDQVLRSYPHECLPSMIFEKESLRNFFFAQ